MPQDVSFDSYFRAGQRVSCVSMAAFSLAEPLETAADSTPMMFSLDTKETSAKIRTRDNGTEDFLLDLASAIESDGGMPGKNIEERVLLSILALLCFLEKGHSSRAGTFRVHVQRLISFLESELVKSLSSEQQISVDRMIKLARSRKTIRGDWHRLAAKPLRDHSAKELWAKIDAALQGIDEP